MSCKKTNCESGSILVETAIVAPVLLLFLMFGLDLFIYTQCQTFVTQATRESALYLATVPGNLSAPVPPSSQVQYQNILNQVDVQGWAEACTADYELEDCAHLNAQIRISRMLENSKVFLDTNNAQMTTTYTVDPMDPTNKFVTVSVSVPVNTYFHLLSANTSKTVQVRRVDT